jgi:hypothetical protein
LVVCTTIAIIIPTIADFIGGFGSRAEAPLSIVAGFLTTALPIVGFQHAGTTEIFVHRSIAVVVLTVTDLHTGRFLVRAGKTTLPHTVRSGSRTIVVLTALDTIVFETNSAFGTMSVGSADFTGILCRLTGGASLCSAMFVGCTFYACFFDTDLKTGAGTILVFVNGTITIVIFSVTGFFLRSASITRGIFAFDTFFVTSTGTVGIVHITLAS